MTAAHMPAGRKATDFSMADRLLFESGQSEVAYSSRSDCPDWLRSHRPAITDFPA